MFFFLSLWMSLCLFSPCLRCSSWSFRVATVRSSTTLPTPCLDPMHVATPRPSLDWTRKQDVWMLCFVPSMCMVHGFVSTSSWLSRSFHHPIRRRCRSYDSSCAHASSRFSFGYRIHAWIRFRMFLHVRSMAIPFVQWEGGTSIVCPFSYCFFWRRFGWCG